LYILRAIVTQFKKAKTSIYFSETFQRRCFCIRCAFQGALFCAAAKVKKSGKHFSSQQFSF
jgi:hypothetical protein